MPDNGNMMECIEVTGMVQGVGFRPFVYNLAKTGSLGGYITNTPKGVTIEIEGKKEAIDKFVKDLMFKPPSLSKIVSLERSVIRHDPEAENKKIYRDFEIRESVRDGHPETLIPPEACTCEECKSELFDTKDRRYLYPFINCTNCGPRFTIMKELPYDRPFTTMADFTRCPSCLSEYTDPGNRRFHAQPNACPVCGPRLELVNGCGKSINGDPVVTAIDYLRQGKIVAIKGLGGFHLAVDGTNNEAVKRLRRKKSREEKPLALMVGSLSEAKKLVLMGLTEERILNSFERPIVLASRCENNRDIQYIADSVAPGIGYLGIMLPYTPLHYLLFYHPEAGGSFKSDITAFHALVMTSGNKSEEPVCKDNDEALERLGNIADAFLLHNRDIFVRCDDSVVRCYDTEVSFIRRSRGFAPSPVFLPDRAIPVLAFGGELKNTLCIVNGNNAFMSQHIGDLENIPTLGFFHEAATHFMKILDLRPHLFAYDLHPDYLSTKYAKKMIGDLDEMHYGAVGVHHHHAHIAGVLAEHGNSGPVIGLSMDGSGYGKDGTVWGGEILICTPHSFT
ncbi:MAG: carbamoyltransferase HypF, partial [Candidatus Latescibacteria bacterium]|nr:carbamoyltransferase HypF [Candidatus Latescibacterota bacterium]